LKFINQQKVIAETTPTSYLKGSGINFSQDTGIKRY
jgi:hypothetical protein